MKYRIKPFKWERRLTPENISVLYVAEIPWWRFTVYYDRNYSHWFYEVKEVRSGIIVYQAAAESFPDAERLCYEYLRNSLTEVLTGGEI